MNSILLMPLLASLLAPNVQVTLEKALANERQAVIRYDAFAQKAHEEGYLGAESLFRAMAQAEGVHAKRFAEVLASHGVTVPASDDSYKPLVGSTATNLRTAAVNETAERDDIYKVAIEVCQRAGDAGTAKIFDQTRDVEVEHANLAAAAMRNLDSMKEPRTYYVCEFCGYTTDINLGGLCPDCMHRDKVHPTKP